MKLQTSQPAPYFSLPDQGGKEHAITDYKGKWIVVYFYPEDDTLGCTAEACALRDNFPRFEDSNAVVLGVSKDSVESHKRFAEKYNLPFTLLSDEKKSMLKQYGVWENERTLRTSFLIDPEGNIAKVYEQVQPAAHAEAVVEDLRRMQ